MYLNNLDNKELDIIPFLKSGIIIDTSVVDILIDGLVASRVCKKTIFDSFDFELLLSFFDLIKLKNQWSKFIITPHILTEVCTHFRNKYSKYVNFKDIVKQITPLLTDMIEKQVEKTAIFNRVDVNNPIIEVGDISIFVIADEIIDVHEKVAILANDRGINNRYLDDPKVLVLDFKNIMLNRL